MACLVAALMRAIVSGECFLPTFHGLRPLLAFEIFLRRSSSRSLGRWMRDAAGGATSSSLPACCCCCWACCPACPACTCVCAGGAGAAVAARCSCCSCVGGAEGGRPIKLPGGML